MDIDTGITTEVYTIKSKTRLIDIFYEISKKDDTAVLLLVGSGKLQPQIVEKVEQLNISEKVIFLGIR